MINLDTYIHGTIKLDDSERPFDFKNNRLIIQPTQEENDYYGNLFTSPKERKKHKCLVGITYDEHLIYFIDVVVVKKVNIYFGYPKAYIILKSNTIDWKYDILNFKKIKLKSNAIDSLQNTTYSHKLRQFFIKKETDSNIDNITKKFEITQGNCELITGYHFITKDNKDRIEITSSLNCSFKESISGFDVYQIVNKINEVFKFIFNRSNIAFSSIKLKSVPIEVKDSIDKTSVPVSFSATMYLLNQTNELNTQNINNTIDPILENFNSLMEVVNKEIISYYPNNDEDFHYVDAYKYIKVCGTFEREFDYCFPDYLEVNEPNYTYVKKRLLNYLIQLDEELKGENGKARNKIKSFKNTITNMNESLEKRLNYAFDEFAFCLQPRFEDYCKRNELSDKTFKDICSCFANKRNKYVHTFNDLGFSKEEIAGFVVVRELIYCMVLKQAGFTNEEIEQMINIFQ